MCDHPWFLVFSPSQATLGIGLATENIGASSWQADPIIALATGTAAAAWAGRCLVQAWQAYKARPVTPRLRRFYPGGFDQKMSRREAALILGVRCFSSWGKRIDSFVAALSAWFLAAAVIGNENELLVGCSQGTCSRGEGQRGAPEGDGGKPPRCRWEPLPGIKDQRGQGYLDGEAEWLVIICFLVAEKCVFWSHT